MRTRKRKVKQSVTTTTVLLAVCLCSSAATAQIWTPFNIQGTIIQATVTTPTNKLSGGTITVEGHLITVPANTIVQFPNTALTWAEVFLLSPAPYRGTQTGLARLDTPPPLTTVQATIRGNRVGDESRAGLITIQEAINNGQGTINFIDYTVGEMRVGGVLNDPLTGARVRLNDYTGRFGRRMLTVDSRFTVDENNPTVRAVTGYPMCLPRSIPDALCPEGNRPRDVGGAFLHIFTMPSPVNGVFPDSKQQAPFEVGDYVTFSGMLINDAPNAFYISADSVIADLGIYTQPGVNPTYVAIDVAIIGVDRISPDLDGLPQEVTLRTRYRGFTTDPTRRIPCPAPATFCAEVDLWAVDLDPCTRGEILRRWTTDGAGIRQDAAPRGRWRFDPGRVAAQALMPPPREVLAVSLNGVYQELGVPTKVANGLFAGQYQLPNQSFTFPEQANPGQQPVPLTFGPRGAGNPMTSSVPFILDGSGPWPGGEPEPDPPVPAGIVGQLNPFPNISGFIAPPPGTICPAGPPAKPGAATFVPMDPKAPVALAPVCDWLSRSSPSMDVRSRHGASMVAALSDACVAQ
jgi:hypothetical protein